MSEEMRCIECNSPLQGDGKHCFNPDCCYWQPPEEITIYKCTHQNGFKQMFKMPKGEQYLGCADCGEGIFDRLIESDNVKSLGAGMQITSHEGDNCEGGHLLNSKYHATDFEHGGDCEWCVVSAGSDQKYWINELNTAYAKGLVSRDAEVGALKEKLKVVDEEVDKWISKYYMSIPLEVVKQELREAFANADKQSGQ